MRSARRPLAILSALAMSSGLVVAMSAPAVAGIHLPLAHGLTSDDRLVTFQVETPASSFSANVAITGLAAGDDVVGLDIRPVSGELYALVKGAASDRLFTVDPATGAATQVGAALTPRLSGTSFGIDFNPEVDRLRVVSDADQNLRFNPVSGGASSNTPATGTTGDLPLSYAAGDAGAGLNPNVTAAAYENNVPGGNPALTPKTELYDVDTDRDALVEQDPPNNGTLVTVGALGVGDVTAVSGLDIAGSDISRPVAYGIFVVGGEDALYTVNTDTGAAAKVGAFPALTGSAVVEDLTIADPRFVVDATAAITEGAPLTVTVRRVGDVRFTGMIGYSTADGSAVAGADYTAASGTLSFAAGATTATFTVPTTDDTVGEAAETFTLTLRGATGQNATVGRTVQTVTVNDNDGGSPAPSATASATPTATMSASPTTAPCSTVNVRVNTPTINATAMASVTVTGARSGATIELQGYSQNHFGTANFDNDTTPVDRTATADAQGAATFNDLRPASNTRLRAREVNCAYGTSAVVNVRATETLQVDRSGTRRYVVSGTSIPARPGGLIISLYRINGAACAAGVEPRNCPGEVLIGQGRADQSTGKYRIAVTLPASDSNKRVSLVVKTGQDAQNAPGRSNTRSLLVL